MLRIILTLLIAVASAVATILEFDDTGIMFAQACAFFLMAVMVTVYMKKKDRSLRIFGYKWLDIRKEKVTLYNIPLLVIVAVQPIMGGFNLELSVTEIVLILIFSLLVGYTEESIFRGIIRKKLHSKGPVLDIVFSSIFFGILHMANALNGNDLIHTLLQVLNAFHFMFDALAQMTSTTIIDKEVLLVSILNILYLIYGGYLIVVLMRRSKLTKPLSDSLITPEN